MASTWFFTSSDKTEYGIGSMPTAAEVSAQVWADAPEIASPLNVTDARDAILAAIASGVTLTASERAAVSVAVESALLNEGDGQQLLQAIVDKIDAYADLDALTLIAIRTQVDNALATYDAPTRAEVTADKAEVIAALPVAPDNAGIAAAVAAAQSADGKLPADTSARLAHLDADISSLPTVAQIEAALLNEADGQQLLQAIADKIGNENVTAATIAAAVWANATRTLTETAGLTPLQNDQLMGLNNLSAAEVDAIIDLAIVEGDVATGVDVTAAQTAVQQDIAGIHSTTINYGEALNVIDSTPRLSVNIGGSNRHAPTVTRHRGDTYPFAVLVANDAGTGQDITGAALILSISADDKPTVADYVAQLTAQVVDAANGLAQFEFALADVDHVGKYHYDVQMTSASGEVRTLARGRWIFEQDISK